QCDPSAVGAGTVDAAGAWATGPACWGAASRPGSEVQAATTASARIDVRMSRVVRPNGPRPPVSSACEAALDHSRRSGAEGRAGGVSGPFGAVGALRGRVGMVALS